MEKELYVAPALKVLGLSSENLMDFGVSGSEADDDFDFAKENDFDDDLSGSTTHSSVWDD